MSQREVDSGGGAFEQAVERTMGPDREGQDRKISKKWTTKNKRGLKGKKRAAGRSR